MLAQVLEADRADDAFLRAHPHRPAVFLLELTGGGVAHRDSLRTLRGFGYCATRAFSYPETGRLTMLTRSACASGRAAVGGCQPGWSIGVSRSVFPRRHSWRSAGTDAMCLRRGCSGPAAPSDRSSDQGMLATAAIMSATEHTSRTAPGREAAISWRGRAYR